MFFVKEENVRPGNRGGKNLFKWDDVRIMNNKDRESYLGVTQSIGFLDKGGKWRKRDWWQSNKSTELNIKSSKKRSALEDERQAIKLEEERLIRESLGLGNVDKVSQSQIKKENLTDYEMKELVKKEGKYNPDDEKLFEFYQNDEHKAGLGMVKRVTFRTNAYDKNTVDNMSKLDGLNPEVGKNDEDNNPYANAMLNNTNDSFNIKVKNPHVSKYVNEYMSSKQNISNGLANNIKSIVTETEYSKDQSFYKEKSQKKKKSKRSRSRSRDSSKTKKLSKDKDSKKRRKSKERKSKTKY